MKKFILITILLSTQVFAANFNARFYQELAKTEKGNISISPISLKMALHLVYLGTAGETKKYFESEFNFPANDRHPFKQEYQIMKEFPKQLMLANSVWFQDIKVIEANYLQEVKTVNANAATINLKLINDWIEKATQGKIKNLVEKLEPNTFAVFVNALYFKADWENQFKKADTTNDFFSISPTIKTKIPLMHQAHDLFYNQDDHAQWVKLPYAGLPFALYVGLPKKRFDLKAVEQNLTDDYLKKMYATMQSTKVIVTLPRFKFDWKSSIKSKLEQMGLTKLFANANYTLLSKSPNLYISDIIQGTSMTVDEKGTEAAAATAVIMEKGLSLQVEPKKFIADQPFLFILRNEKTGEVYFMGRIVKP